MKDSQDYDPTIIRDKEYGIGKTQHSFAYISSYPRELVGEWAIRSNCRSTATLKS